MQFSAMSSRDRRTPSCTANACTVVPQASSETYQWRCSWWCALANCDVGDDRHTGLKWSISSIHPLLAILVSRLVLTERWQQTQNLLNLERDNNTFISIDFDSTLIVHQFCF